MKSFLEEIAGFLFMIVIMFVLMFFLVAFFKGVTWFGAKVLPWLLLISVLIFLIDILIMLPLAIFKKTRGFSAICLLISSYVFGITCWVVSLLVTYVIWGLFAIFVGLMIFGVGVVPIAILATLFTGKFYLTLQIIVLIALTLGSRLFSFYLAEKTERNVLEEY
ncbi:hypothetical protein ACFL2K_04990 [Candidatus Margulisiibacteriota bacterium]